MDVVSTLSFFRLSLLQGPLAMKDHNPYTKYRRLDEWKTTSEGWGTSPGLKFPLKTFAELDGQFSKAPIKVTA